MIAAIQLRGSIGAQQGVKDTLKMLGMFRKNNLVLLEGNPVEMGMLHKCKDFITYGPVSDELAERLQKKADERGTVALHPPRGGMRSIKRPFNAGGDLGKRGEAINELITRMLP